MCQDCQGEGWDGAAFRQLTYAGQLMYAQLIKDGYSPAEAIRDARYSHGTQKG